MTDDLVKRLREYRIGCGIHCSAYDSREPLDECIEAADRIEKLEEDVGVLIAASIRLTSRIDLDSDHYVDRIEKLKAALREIAMLGYWDGDRAMGIARKALEGKDG